MSSNVIPNTFQCHNLYIDHLLEHLTDSEVRVLWFATRHILGWQDKIKSRRGHISLTMFENGFTDSSGNYYGPCGLGKGAIITACKSLVEFKLLEKVGEPTEDGQSWELTTSNIQWDKLTARTAERLEKQKAKTKKATTAMMNKRSGTSDVPLVQYSVGGTSDVTMQGTSDVTMQGNVARTESNPLSNPSSNTEEKTNTSAASADTSTASNPVEEKTDAVQQAEEYIEAVTKTKAKNPRQEAVKLAFKIEAGGYAELLAKQLMGGENRGKRKEYAIDPPMTPAEVVACFDWYKSDLRYKDQAALPSTAETLFERAMEFRAQPDHDKYVNRAAPAFEAMLNPPEPETAKELPPPNPELAKKIDDILNAMARGEDISELISA